MPLPENGTNVDTNAQKQVAKDLKENTFGPVMDPTFNDIMKVITLISPFFVVLLLVTMSIINSDIKGFVYLGGVVFMYGFFYMFQANIGFNTNKERVCAIWNIGPFKFPSLISAIYTYTVTYLIYPMIMNEVYNFPLIIILLIIYISDVFIRCFKMGCSNFISVAIGSVFGIICAIAYILILSNHTELLYYHDLLSSKLACSVPSKQKFKCSVYNNGELVSSALSS
jgi:hypothetical protein